MIPTRHGYNHYCKNQLYKAIQKLFPLSGLCVGQFSQESINTGHGTQGPRVLRAVLHCSSYVLYIVTTPKALFAISNYLLTFLIFSVSFAKPDLRAQSKRVLRLLACDL